MKAVEDSTVMEDNKLVTSTESQDFIVDREQFLLFVSICSASFGICLISRPHLRFSYCFCFYGQSQLWTERNSIVASDGIDPRCGYPSL